MIVVGHSLVQLECQLLFDFLIDSEIASDGSSEQSCGLAHSALVKLLSESGCHPCQEVLAKIVWHNFEAGHLNVCQSEKVFLGVSLLFMVVRVVQLHLLVWPNKIISD